MTNREVLAKFIKQAFNIIITDSFVIKCEGIYCAGRTCADCPGEHYNFWDKEFIGDENVQINSNNSNERVAIKEISW